MFERTRLSVAVAAVLGAGIAAAPNVNAQTPPPAQSLDKVEITGSLIRRIEGETALPVVTITTEELQRAGVTNAEQAVRLITQQQGGMASSGSVSQTNGAAAYASLRSLGAQRTLVLLNGKRVVSNPFASIAVDLNTLPIAAVQRIEVLTDGASAIYGTDAIAGVINFITRKDYKGITVAAEAQIPEESGGEIYTTSLLGGVGDFAKQGWNVYGSLNYRAGKPMGANEREFSRSAFIPSQGFNGLSPTTFPANYSQPAPPGAPATAPATIPTTNPTLPNCFPPTSINSGPTFAQGGFGLGTNLCGADTQEFTNAIPEQDQWSAFLRSSLALGENNTAFLEYFYSSNQVRTLIGPAPETGLTMTPASPFFPGNGITPISDPALDPTRNISVAWRMTVLGPRETEQKNDTQRAVLGFEGAAAGWDYQAAALWSKSETENIYTGGWARTSAVRNGVTGAGGTPFLNPFGNQTPQGLALLQANAVTGKVQEGESELRSVSGTASRQFFQLPGGPLTVALATEYREEEMLFQTDVAKVSDLSTSGLAGAGALREGDRDIYAATVEFSFPVLKNVELGAAVRYDDYSDFGSTTNPKFTVRFTPNPQLLLRASYNTGFAAPTLTQLYLPEQTTFTPARFNDPVLCPTGTAIPGAQQSRDCGIQFQQLQGGNRNLLPEESDAWSVGIVLQPIPSFSFGIDYWSYKIENSISNIGTAAIFGDPARYASRYVRCSQAPAARRAAIGACQNPGTVDPLAYVININENLGNVETSGLDLQATWQGAPTPYGRFSLGARGTYVMKYEFQTEIGGAYFNPVGNYNERFTTSQTTDAGPVIRYQQVTSLGWQLQAWTASLLHRYQTGYTDQNSASSVAPAFRNNRVKPYSIFDLTATYTGFKGITLRGGVLNVLDEDPPFTNQSGRFQARGYDDRFHNPLGRVYVLGASYQF